MFWRKVAFDRTIGFPPVAHRHEWLPVVSWWSCCCSESPIHSLRGAIRLATNLLRWDSSLNRRESNQSSVSTSPMRQFHIDRDNAILSSCNSTRLSMHWCPTRPSLNCSRHLQVARSWIRFECDPKRHLSVVCDCRGSSSRLSPAAVVNNCRSVGFLRLYWLEGRSRIMTSLLKMFTHEENVEWIHLGSESEGRIAPLFPRSSGWGERDFYPASPVDLHVVFCRLEQRTPLLHQYTIGGT